MPRRPLHHEVGELQDRLCDFRWQLRLSPRGSGTAANSGRRAEIDESGLHALGDLLMMKKLLALAAILALASTSGFGQTDSTLRRSFTPPVHDVVGGGGVGYSQLLTQQR